MMKDFSAAICPDLKRTLQNSRDLEYQKFRRQKIRRRKFRREKFSRKKLRRQKFRRQKFRRNTARAKSIVTDSLGKCMK